MGKSYHRLLQCRKNKDNPVAGFGDMDGTKRSCYNASTTTTTHILGRIDMAQQKEYDREVQCSKCDRKKVVHTTVPRNEPLNFVCDMCIRNATAPRR